MHISVYIIIHHDLDLLPRVIDRVYDLVDEVVLVDGPYAWLNGYFEGLGLNEGPRLLGCSFRGEPLVSAPKVRYFHGIWKDEIEKRLFAYEQTSGDIVLSLDSDELVSLDLEALRSFAASGASVASWLTTNRAGAEAVLCSRAEESSAPTAPEIWWHKIFKRWEISAQKHLNYLWLVFVPSGPKDCSLIYPYVVGTLDHMTLARTRAGLFAKFGFYRAGYWLERGGRDPILNAGGWDSYAELREQLSLEEYTDAFLRLGYDSVGCPKEWVVVRGCSQPELKDLDVRLEEEWNAELGLELARPLVALPGVEIFCRLPRELQRDRFALEVRCESVTGLLLVEHCLYYGRDNRENRRVFEARSGEDGVFRFELSADRLPGEDLYSRVLSLYPTRVTGRFGRIVSLAAERRCGEIPDAFCASERELRSSTRSAGI